jgi:hypothetical protein
VIEPVYAADPPAEAATEVSELGAACVIPVAYAVGDSFPGALPRYML